MFLMGDVALILPGAKLNAQSTARRTNYMDVICNLLSVWLYIASLSLAMTKCVLFSTSLRGGTTKQSISLTTADCRAKSILSFAEGLAMTKKM